MRYLLLFPILVACSPEVSSDDDLTPRCSAEVYAKYVGASADVLNTIKLPKSVRILRPEDAISMDFDASRLTIDIDQLNRVSSVTCR
ncbi:MAG: I78 family peptidase inhibitor [Litoreibacter sp.]